MGDGNVDPAAMWPDGWRHMMEADTAPRTQMRAARRAARNEKRWVKGKPLPRAGG
jgi:hypothetical protein